MFLIESGKNATKILNNFCCVFYVSVIYLNQYKTDL